MEAKQIIELLSQGTLLLIVFSVGLRADWRDVIATTRQTGLLLKGLFVVNLLVPAVAVLACMPLPMDPAIKTGIVIAAVSPLAPLTTGKLVRAGVDASFTVGLYVALIAASVLFIPVTLTILSELLPPDATVSLAPIVRLVLTSVLAPLGLGVLVGTLAPNLAQPFAGMAIAIGYAALGVLAIPIIYAQAGHIVGLVGNGTILAIAITVIAGLAGGHALGGPDPVKRNALALAAATRHPGIAALIVSSNFADPRIMLSVMLFLVVGMVASAGYQIWAKRVARRQALWALAA